MLRVNKERVEYISTTNTDGCNFFALVRDATGFIEITNHYDGQYMEIPFEVLKEIYEWALERLKNE